MGALLRQLDFHGQELRIIDADLAGVALASADVERLMTIPGVDATVALSIVAAVGDFARFGSPEKLVRYLGLSLDPPFGVAGCVSGRLGGVGSVWSCRGRAGRWSDGRIGVAGALWFVPRAVSGRRQRVRESQRSAWGLVRRRWGLLECGSAPR